MTLFDWINQIRVKKRKWSSFTETDHKGFNIYMVNKILSMDPNLIEIIDYCQQYTTRMKPCDVYKMYCEIIPKGKKYIEYIKARNNTKYEDWLVELLTNHFEVGKAEAIEYLDVLYRIDNGKNHLCDIAIMYGSDIKKMKKAGIYS